MQKQVDKILICDIAVGLIPLNNSLLYNYPPDNYPPGRPPGTINSE